MNTAKSTILSCTVYPPIIYSCWLYSIRWMELHVGFILEKVLPVIVLVSNYRHKTFLYPHHLLYPHYLFTSVEGYATLFSTQNWSLASSSVSSSHDSLIYSVLSGFLEIDWVFTRGVWHSLYDT